VIEVPTTTDSRRSMPAERRRRAWRVVLLAMIAFGRTPARAGQDGSAQAAAAEGAAAAEALVETPITDGDRDHWSFRQLVRPPLPPLPPVSGVGWSRGAIDRFVLARLDTERLRPAPEADRATLARRLSFDLLGLPPSLELVDEFRADPSADAYERLVDRLLASPHYGPRWAQHWLDLARFAETDGFEHDKPRDTAWQYRDWVIDAWNSDMPFDQFVRWQIAGDLLEPDNAAAVTATAFCLSGPDMPDINSQEERKHNLLNEMTATVGSVILGLQVGCAQCHDHMFDPISQADFYRLRAFFQPAVQPQRDKSLMTLTHATAEDERSYLLIRGDWRRPGPELHAAFPRIANPQATDARAVAGASPRWRLAQWLTSADNPLTARVFVNRLWQHHFGRGLCNSPSDVGAMGDLPSHPELLDWLACELIDSGWQIKRLQRLIVTSSVYRQQSYAPCPDKVDPSAWADSWHRDAEATLLSRFPRRRLEAEAVRDAMYAVSGSLNTQMGGPGVRPPLPSELVETLLSGQWTVSPRQADHYRRSAYVFARRNLRYPLLAAFDRPAANSSCAARAVSTTAPQALLLLNSAMSLDAAQRLAGAVWDQAGADVDQQINQAFRRALGRPPNENERHKLQQFCQQQTELIRAEGRPRSSLALPITRQPIADQCAAAALTDLCLALINSSEFLYID
jgi:hypothetical protein